MINYSKALRYLELQYVAEKTALNDHLKCFADSNPLRSEDVNQNKAFCQSLEWVLNLRNRNRNLSQSINDVRSVSSGYSHFSIQTGSGLQSLMKNNRSPDVRGEEVSVKQLMNRSMHKAGFESFKDDNKLPSVYRKRHQHNKQISINVHHSSAGQTMEPVKEENNQDKSTLNQEDYSIDHDHLNNSVLQNNSSML